MITTFTGKLVDPMNLCESDIDIRDIARSLSTTCRYRGHVRRFYSVAEHSVRVAMALPIEFRRLALLHDAPEAYLCDVPGPEKDLYYLKVGPAVLPFTVVENWILGTICRKFGVGMEGWDAVKREDLAIRDLEINGIVSGEDYKQFGDIGHPWEYAEHEFLEFWSKL